MRVGLITGEYPPDRGGVGDFSRELARALAAGGTEVHVLTTARPSTTPEDESRRLQVHRAIPGWGWRLWHAIGKQQRTLDIDVLNIQFQTAAFGMHPAISITPPWFLGAGQPPIIVTFHDLRVPYLFPKAGGLRWLTVLTMARRASGVIVTNREDEVQLAQQGLATPLSRIPIGSNIHPELPTGYDRHAARAKWGVGPGDVLLAYFGFLNERKGGEELIATLALLIDRGIPAHLLLIGGRTGSSDPTNVDYARRVETLMEQRRVLHRVHRTGFVSPQEVSVSLTACDVCLLPYRDGVSLRHGSLHACLAHGLPIVTTQSVIPTPELGDGENVLLVPTGDAVAMANAVTRLAEDRELAQKLVHGAAALAAEFTWDRIADRTLEFYRELVG